MISANLPRIPTFDDWRGAARNMLAIAAKPDEVVWRTEGETDLFASAPTPNLQPATPIFVPRAFIDIAGTMQPAPAPRFSRTHAEVARPPAHAGAHTREVFEAWGVDAATSDGCAEAGAIRQAG